MGIDCYKNPQISETNIQSIDISNNKKLKYSKLYNEQIPIQFNYSERLINKYG